MSLRSIAVRNYRCFQERQELEISPITVLLGKNNAGKSAILRAPLLVEAGLSTSSAAAFDLDTLRSPEVSHFSDLIFGREPYRALEIEITMDYGTVLGARVGFDDAVLRPVVQTLYLQAGGRDLVMTLDPKRDRYETTLDGTTMSLEVTFRGLRPTFFADLSPQVSQMISHHWPPLGPVHYIGPFRKQLPTVHRVPHNPPQEVGTYGERALEFLAQDNARGKNSILRKVNEYLVDLLPGYELRENQIDTKLWQTVVLGPWRAEINLADVGSGVSQVLPILVQCAARETGPQGQEPALHLIEEPELHLHPGAHGIMADLLLSASRNTGDRFIVETHSETFLLRLRRRIAEQTARAEEIGLYVVEQNGDGATLRRIGIDEFGQLDYWPDGYFDQDYEEVKAMTREQLKRGVKGAA